MIYLVVCDRSGRIIYQGPIYPGSNVDFGIFKGDLARFDFSGKVAWVDLGFTGIPDHLPPDNVKIGVKKKKGQGLKEAERALNKEISKNRAIVENAIGGKKRYCFLRNENRIKSRARIGKCVEICSALHNYKIGIPVSEAA